jgi:hypothetical protein
MTAEEILSLPPTVKSNDVLLLAGVMWAGTRANICPNGTTVRRRTGV